MAARPIVKLVRAALAAALCWTASAVADTHLLGPVQVVDIETGEVRSGRMLRIRDGFIEIETEYAPPVAGEAESRLNGAGGYVIPALAEMHAHVPPHSAGEQHVRDVLALYLVNGITTIRGMLGEPWHLELRALLERGEWDGPRLVTSGPSFNGRTVTSPEQAARRVREQAADDYDFLKIHPGLDADQYAAIAEAAQAAGIPFAGHVPVAVGLGAALAAGQRTIDHLDGYAQKMLPPGSPLEGTEPEFFGVNLGEALDPSLAPGLARATLAAGTWNVPTQTLLVHIAGDRSMEALLARPEMRYLNDERTAEWRQRVETLRGEYTAEQRQGLLQARRALLLALQRAGAGLLLGSDAPQIMNVPGFSIHEELALLVDAGLTPLEALQTGTRAVAQFFDEPDRGAVAEGHAADLVVLGGNPLEDIGATRRVIGVMRAGRWYDRAWIDRRLAEIDDRGI